MGSSGHLLWRRACQDDGSSVLARPFLSSALSDLGRDGLLEAYRGGSVMTCREQVRECSRMDVRLPDPRSRVRAALNVSVSDLAKAAINDLLAKSEDDFDRAATRVLNKNAELYRRLA